MKDVIVIGAGMAGLAAARTLAESGNRVSLIEARDRPGGRIRTLDGEFPIELGAEFIHGFPSELIDLVNQAGLHHFELQGESLCFGKGQLGNCGPQPEVDRLFHQLSRSAHLSADLSFHKFLVQQGLHPEARTATVNYVEGFNAADADRISVLALAKQQLAEDRISGDKVSRVTEGYARVPEFLLRKFSEAGGEWIASTPVRSLEWKRGFVRVTSHNGGAFQATAAIVTLPLGVLQARQVHFAPEPEILGAAADKLVMGAAARVVYQFDQQFWPNDLSFLFSPEHTPPTWWTTRPQPSPTLTGWIAGRKLSGLRVQDLPELGLTALSTILGTNAGSRLVGWHQHDWLSDPLTLGAYSYVPTGALHASEELCRPVEQTLFFAGEHTDTRGYWGTVHGALHSGYRAAKQVLAVQRGSKLEN